MRIALAQINSIIAHFDYNFNKIEEAVKTAKSQNADIVVFPELTVCGYPPRDFLEFEDFIAKCNDTIERIKSLADDIAIVVGAPIVNPNPEGKDLFNAALFIADGKVLHTAYKTLLPTYDIFDEYRYFEPGENFEILEYKGKKIALTVCEDIWNIGNENPLYKVCPMDNLVKHQPDLMINLSASPFDFNHATDRIDIVKANATRYNLPVFYANSVGAQTEVVFDGGSLVVNSNGVVCDELPYFKECVKTFDLSEVNNQTSNKEQAKDKTALMHDAIVLGIRDYFEKLGFKKAILGLSGGVDSALTLALAVEALGAENVMSVLLPSEYSSNHSVDDSKALCENLGSPYEVVSIEDAYNTFMATLKPHFKDLPFNVAEENLQARSRGVILMAMANKFGYILLNTSNKSEAAVGYGTLYGDMCGGISVLGDVYKTEVYDICNYINRDKEIIPNHILTKPPSAELRPNQKDSDSLPDYDILDTILHQYIELKQGPKEIIAQGYDKALVKRILKMVNINEWKRYQTAPMIRVSAKAFGMGRRMPIVAKYLSAD